MTEQPGLFDEQEAVGPINTAVIKALVEDHYHGAVDPRTNLPFKTGIVGEFRDSVMYTYHKPGDEIDIEGLGVFTFLTSWGENRDGTENGLVIKDMNTMNEYMITYTYSSWDVPDDYRVVLAEAYTFKETRWRAKR